MTRIAATAAACRRQHDGPGAPSVMHRLKRRGEFLAAARAASRSAPGVVVQMRKRGDDGPARVGFTVTRKLGGAVRRNRIRRRLKEAVRLGLEGAVRPGRDYVFIGRPEAKLRPFWLLQQDLKDAVERVETSPIKSGGGARKPERPKPDSPKPDSPKPDSIGGRVKTGS